ncbi:MAG TPA: hypothetical protein PL033_09050 [Candidatus Brocadiia bacterium]|nr:hypothetical protein [Candidatus Brocadiia bacterium]
MKTLLFSSGTSIRDMIHDNVSSGPPQREAALRRLKPTRREIHRFLSPENSTVHTILVALVVLIVFLILISLPGKKIRGK